MARVAINGLGRIGRATLKIILETPGLELVAANDLSSAENLAYLLKYDTAYGRYEKPVSVIPEGLLIGHRELPLQMERDPALLRWRDFDVDLVFECTGVLTKKTDLMKHIQAGAKSVILSAIAKSEDVPTVVYGVNSPGDGGSSIISCASCTTNCITPVVEVMGRRIGIKKAMMTTLHAYTSSQSLLDRPSRQIRRGRAGGANLIPTSTGAAIATTKALPQYKGRFDGLAVRAPIPVGSIADIVFLTERGTTKDEVNAIFREEASSERYLGILGVSEDPIVSSDIIQDSRASVVDLGLTQVVDGDLVKVLSWYDNEWGYSYQMVRQGVQLLRAMKAGEKAA